MSKNIFMDIPEDEQNDLAQKIDALRCDIVKSTLFPHRVRIAKALLRLIQADPELKKSPDDAVFDLFNEAAYFFGEDVYDLLKNIAAPDKSREDKLAELQMVFSTYFDLRTLK